MADLEKTIRSDPNKQNPKKGFVKHSRTADLEPKSPQKVFNKHLEEYPSNQKQVKTLVKIKTALKKR